MSTSPPSEEPRAMPTYPPYPPYEPQPVPPSVADVILLGQDIRFDYKSGQPLKLKPSPRPARPKAIKATTEVKMTNRERLAHARCLRRYGAVLTDRLERISKPDRRKIIMMWRERQDTLPVDTIARLRAMLDADEPFKPEQAYDYFLNLRKSKKKPAPGGRRRKEMRKDVMALCEDRRYEWARNAAVAFARGIQQRLARPGMYSLQDEMLRLSNIILQDICGFLKTRAPSRHCVHPKARLMVEIADKVAVWINEILTESEDRMLMMDFDENEEVTRYLDGEAAFADDFLNMMGGAALLKGPSSAYLNFTGPMLEAFTILTDAMYEKAKEPFITYGKFEQNYEEAADELKKANDLRAKDFNSVLADKVAVDLNAIVESKTPKDLAPLMQKMVRVCSNYLAQHAEHNKEKGKAFQHLVKNMKGKSKDQLYDNGKDKKSMGRAASDLLAAKGFETTHDDPNLSQAIHSNLKKAGQAPSDLNQDMKDTLDITSKYLSQRAVDARERGPAFDILINQLKTTGHEEFAPEHKDIKNNHGVAYVLQSAPGLSVTDSIPKVAEEFSNKLRKNVDIHTPAKLEKEMNDVVKRSGQYLSSFVKNREEVFNILVNEMKANPEMELVTRNDYTMKCAEGAKELEIAPNLVPHLPIKDIGDEIKDKLNTLVRPKTTPALEKAMSTVTDDAGKYLSQMVAIRSGAAGPNYALDYLAAVKEGIGDKALYDHQGYAQNYKDAAGTLKYAGELEHDPNSDALRHQIHSEMKSGVGSEVSPTMHEDIHGVMSDAAKHLAKEGAEKGAAMGHLIGMMKNKGDEPLAVLQGYEQTYNDAARRLDNATSLATDKVEKAGYENVRSKLTQLADEHPESKKHAKRLPEVIEESSKFLAAPVPESDAEKRAVLGDMIGRKGDEKLAQGADYKMNYTEAGKELMKAQKGKTGSTDSSMQDKIQNDVKNMIPEKRYQEMLQDTVAEGAAHLTDVVKGRGEALDAIEKGMKKEKDGTLVSVGSYEKSYDQGAKMLKNAQSLTGGTPPSPSVYKDVQEKIDGVDTSAASAAAQKHMQATSELASKYIAGEATAKSGLTPEQLAALEGEYGFGPGIGPDGKPIAGGKGGLSSDGKSLDGTSVSGDGKDGKGRTIGGKDGSKDDKSVDGKLSSDSKALSSDGRGLSSDGKSLASDGKDGKGVSIGDKDGKGVSSDGKGISSDGKGISSDGKGISSDGKGISSDSKGKGGLFGDDFSLSSSGIGQLSKGGRPEGIRSDGGVALKSPPGTPLKKATKQAKPADNAQEDALGFLHKELQAKGDEVLYKQPLTTLTHKGASDWIKKEPKAETDSSIKDSADTNRLAHKFERKLNALVEPKIPEPMKEPMQDVIIEKSRLLSEHFVEKNYKALVQERLVSEMQKKGNEILVDVDGNTETYFYAAQRLKTPSALEAPDPWPQVAHFLHKKLDDLMKVRPMPRKLVNTTKEHTKVAANYLSTQVTLPDDRITAYVALLEEMEANGDQELIDGPIAKSYKDSAAYLRDLTSFIDRINRSNPALKASIVSKLEEIMPKDPTGYTKAALDSVIQDCATLLTSYIMLQGEKTEALKVLIENMDKTGTNVLLRHGDICKTYKDGADRLRGKNADQIGLVSNVDPVVARKISIKLNNLMKENTPPQFETIMDDVIEDATLYLAANFLHPHIIKVCKCMKNVFVQCELWCDEILRHVSRPCCTCSRHTVSGLCSSHRIFTTKYNAPDVEISLVPCPDRQKCLAETKRKAAAAAAAAAAEASAAAAAEDTDTSKTPTNQKPTTSYALHSIVYDNLPFHYVKSKPQIEPTREVSFPKFDEEITGKRVDLEKTTKDETKQRRRPRRPDNNLTIDTLSRRESYVADPQIFEASKWKMLWQTANTIFGHMHLHKDKEAIAKLNTNDSQVSIVTTDEMSDWHAMVVSLLWNMQAWRRWIQDNINKALEPETAETSGNCWLFYEKRVTTEALKWRHYNIFSRQLTLRLASRYKNKRVVSPTRATDRTDEHFKRQSEMLAVTDMFRVWTQWLSSVIQETNSVKCREGSTSAEIERIRWNYYKEKVQEYADHWQTFNVYLKSCWESDSMKLMSGLMSHWEPQSAVWVVSACGAVPSGAVACGEVRGESTWVARTTHRRRVLPGTLHPSKHCCIVYAEGAVHHYTKYQVLCNANVSWLAWRSGEVSARAVCIADGVYAGRVLYRGSHLLGPVLAPSYRCHVVLFGRAFAFNCYQLLVQVGDD